MFSVFFHKKKSSHVKQTRAWCFQWTLEKFTLPKLLLTWKELHQDYFWCLPIGLCHWILRRKRENGKAGAESRSCHSSEACRSCPLLKFQCYFGAFFPQEMSYSGICAMLRIPEILIVSVARCIDCKALKISNYFLTSIILELLMGGEKNSFKTELRKD